jgi:hypothetical protein
VLSSELRERFVVARAQVVHNEIDALFARVAFAKASPSLENVFGGLALVDDPFEDVAVDIIESEKLLDSGLFLGRSHAGGGLFVRGRHRRWGVAPWARTHHSRQRAILEQPYHRVSECAFFLEVRVRRFLPGLRALQGDALSSQQASDPLIGVVGEQTLFDEIGPEFGD